MVSSTLADIKKKARRLSASPSINQLSEADLEHYIDTVYQQDLPASLKLQSLRGTYNFYTLPNEDQYALDTDVNFNLTPPCYIDGREARFSQSEGEFYREYPRTITELTGSTGDGSAGPYSFTLTSIPVLKRNVTLTVIDSNGDTQTARDEPDTGSNLTGTWVDAYTGAVLAGTINYATGAITITWPQTIPNTQSIQARVHTYTASRPHSILFYQNNIIVRPVPDQAYSVSIESYKRPSQLLSSDSVSPDIKQWWQFIAIGAAVKILQDRQDIESLQNVIPFYEEQKNLLIYRTATQQAPERTATIYTDSMGSTHGDFSNGYGGF